MCVYSTDSHDKIRDNFEWTSYGKIGRDPAKTQLLKDLDPCHNVAIIESQSHLSPHIKKIFQDEIEYRKQQKLKEIDNATSKT